MKKLLCLPLAIIGLSACTTLPQGPTVQVMPAPGKPFEVFTQEDQQCRAYAASSSGTTSNDASVNNMAGSMALGTVVGAAAGALMGGHQGAGVGAGVGLLAGTAAGSGQSGYAGRDAQYRYNLAYEQCMYAKGNQVPGRSYMSPSTSYPPPRYP